LERISYRRNIHKLRTVLQDVLLMDMLICQIRSDTGVLR